MKIIKGGSAAGGGGGGSGTVGPSTSPRFAYFNGATTVTGDANMLKGAQGTELLAISYLLNQGTTAEYYVSKTGNDSNAGTIGSPFLTIARGIQQWAANLRPGNCVLNIGAGTYDEQLTAPNFLANSTTGIAPSVLQIVGADTEDPSQTVINVDADTVFKSYNTQTVLYFDGITFASDTLGTSDTFGLDVRLAAVVLGNVNFDGTRSAIRIGYGGLVFWLNNNDGGQIDAFLDGILVDQGRFICAADLNIAGARNSGCRVINNGIVELTSDVSTFTAGGESCVNNIAVESGGIFTTGSGITFALSEANTTFSSVAFRLDSGKVNMGSGCTVNITDCSQSGYFTGNSVWKDNSCVFNYLGSTGNNWYIGDNSTVLNSDQFTTGVINSTSDAGTNFALDWRYISQYSASALAGLPSSATRYISTNGLSATYIPFYIAQGNEIVDLMEIRTLTAAGVGLTDTYTLQLNGADTAMVASLNDTTSGDNNTNKIILSSGDSVGVKVLSATASATTNVYVQISVRKLPS
jgi:hypothetical protein